MPPKPQYYHDLVVQVEVLVEQTNNLRDDVGDLREKTNRLQEGHDNLKDSIEENRRDVAAIKESLISLTKRADEWDRRLWSFVALTIGALLSLTSGLVVILATR